MQIESIADLALTTPGQYFVRVSGVSDSVQLFGLALWATGLVVAPTGDFEGSGTVDGRHFLKWQRSLGASGPSLPADSNHDGVVNAADLALWKQTFSQTPGAKSMSGAVPEPTGATLLIVGLIGKLLPRTRWS
jgi:hypothetical protein